MKNLYSLIQNLIYTKHLLMACGLMLVGGLTAQPIIVDYEAPNTSYIFNYFANGAVGGVTSIIANPDPSGANTSPNVGEFVKGAGGEFFAGAITNLSAGPAPTASMDFTIYKDVCMKVWFDAPGNVLLKCEAPIVGGGTWEQLQQVTTINTWTEICFDGTLPDQGGGNNGPAIGKNFRDLVLFFDFGAQYGVNHTYYFDDIVMKGVAPPPAFGDITFSVDMKDFPNPFTTVFIAGTFNNWSQFGNPLSDPDGDNIWETTITNLPFAQIEYKFQLDGWAQEETLTVGDPCTLTTGPFTNRVYQVTGDATLATVCWNSCISCFKVPTMSEWGVFILALLMITAAAVFIVGFEKQSALATNNNMSIPNPTSKVPFNKANYFAAMKHAIGVGIIGFAVIYIGWGEIVNADFIGMFISVPILAYLIHLFKK